MFHYRKTRKKYTSYPKPDSCDFCNPANVAKAMYETKNVYIIPNRVFYDLWEMRSVEDHLLVIPKPHTSNLVDINSETKLEIIDILGEYETKGYNIYARAVGSHTRSVEHQHTHLIKTHSSQARIMLAVTKPHLLIKL